MFESIASSPDEAVVRHYLTALAEGHVLDALNAFSMDAQVRDPSGRERHGIREIAAAFASQERPMTVDIEDLEKKGEVVAVRVRMTFQESREPREYRGVFRVRRDRIHSLEIALVPARRARRDRASPSA